jgi:hypothetical protein
MRPFRTYLIGGGVSGALLAGTLAAFLSVTTFVSRTAIPAGDASRPTQRDFATIQVGPVERRRKGIPILPSALAPAPATEPRVLPAGLDLMLFASVAQPWDGGAGAAGERPRRTGGRSVHTSAAGATKQRVRTSSSGDFERPVSPSRSLPLGHTRHSAGLPPGLAKKATGEPPGLATEAMSRPPGLAKAGKTPPGQARKRG